MSTVLKRSFNMTDVNSTLTTTTPSTLEEISNEIIDYFESHREQIPLLVVVYILTIIWILYVILYHSRIQGIVLSHILQRFYFKDASQIKFDSFSVSFISGKIMFRNLHYATGSYFVFVKDGCLIFRYWSKAKKKPVIRLQIHLYHFDMQICSPIRSNTFAEVNNSSDELHRGSMNGLSGKADDTQSVNTTKGNDESNFVNSLRSLFPSVEIKVEHGRISVGHHTLPYGLSLRFSTMNSTFTSQSPSRTAPEIDLMTLLYSLTYRNLQVQLIPVSGYKEEIREMPPPIPTTKGATKNAVQIFECPEGELEYEQDVPGKMSEPLQNGQAIPDVAWEIRMKCNKKTKIAYGPWADRQRELLWQYFLPTLYEESAVTPEPSVGQTRIFRSVRFKLSLNCPTVLDLYFMNKTKLQQLHLECPSKGSSFDAILPFSTNPDGFDTSLSINIGETIAQTNLPFTPFLHTENIEIKVHIHYPRLWNSLQDWIIDIDAKKAQVYFVFEHKNFFQALIADFGSSVPPDIYSFTPFIYNITLRGELVEVLVPCNQGNWIDCSNDKAAENTYVSLCAKSLVLTYPLPFLEFCPVSTPMDLNIEVNDVLARLVIPESNRMFYIVEGLDAHKQFYAPDGIKSHLPLSDIFEKRNGCFECGEVNQIKILVQILLHSSPPVDMNRTDLLHVQQIKSMGNRHTFHPNKLKYDVFNLELDIGPVNLLLHGFFLKKLWWVKENLFGWDQSFHDIREPDLIRENKIVVHDDPLIDMIDESRPFDPRYFRPLMVTLRVALHNVTLHLLHHTEHAPSPIGFCERLCVEMTTDLNETRLQVLFLPVNVYVEDTIVRNKSDHHLSTGSLQLSGLIIRGHAMLSHEGLPPERETLEYAWQMEILLGKISARLTMIQMEKILGFVKNFYLQIMEDEYTLVRSPVMDKTKWIEKLKYDVLRFSLDSVDLNLIETGNAINVQVTPVRLCMCNMHTSTCNEGLTLKVGAIQMRQLLRLHPGSWLEAGSIHIPELRINAKFDCHGPAAANTNEQLEFLRRHDQYSQRLHFLYTTKSQQSSGATGAKRPSTIVLPYNTFACACLGGSPHYYTLVQGEQFFRSTFRLSEQPSFGLSLFQPDVHVIHSHPIFKHKYNWHTYSHSSGPTERLNDEEIFYPFDFCAQTQTYHNKLTEHYSPHSVPANLSTFSRSNSVRNLRHKSFAEPKSHKRSSSSIACHNNDVVGSSSGTLNDAYATPNDQLSSHSSSQRSLHQNNQTKSVSIASLTPVPHDSPTNSSPLPFRMNLPNKISDEQNDSLSTSSRSSTSTDSLTILEEILKEQQQGATSSPQKVSESSTENKSIPQPSLPGSSWISLRNQMKMAIPKSTLLSTTYIRYLSHYRSTTWSNQASFPPIIQQEQINLQPLLDFNCVSNGFSCSYLSESSQPTPSRPQFPAVNSRPRLSVAPTLSTLYASNVIATEREVCLRFIGALNILCTPLMLECLNTYIDTWKTYELHPMSILDGLHFQAQTTANSPSTSIDLSATKISLQLPKINVCLLQAGLAEDNVQLTELRTPVDIVTMSLFALSCKQIQMETILSNRDQSTTGVFKIQSLTGQFRRFENDFSSLEHVNIHAIQSQRCRLQFNIPTDIQTHLPMNNNQTNVGFVMNEFGFQRLCFKLINNAAKQQLEKKLILPIMTQVDETHPGKTQAKQKSKRKQSTDPSVSSPTAAASSPTTVKATTSVVSNPSSSSVFDGSIDHVWITFPEPPRHTYSNSKRRRTSTTSITQLNTTPKKHFSYTRFDWNFLSTLSPTILGWFCVLDRVQKPIEHFLQKRQKRIDAVLAYFLIETKPEFTLPESKFYELFTPKTKYLLSHPVCQLVTELRKHFNKSQHININLQSHILPDKKLLKQGIREACREWTQTFKRQPHFHLYINPPVPLSTTTTSPIDSILPTNSNEQEQSAVVMRARTPTVGDRLQSLFTRDSSAAGASDKSSSAVRRRMTVQNTRSSASTRDTIIELVQEPSSVPERRRASSLIAPSGGHVNIAFEEGETLRRLEPTANVNNTIGYARLNVAPDESDADDSATRARANKRNRTNSFTEIVLADVGPDLTGSVEQLFKILLEYAGVELSVTSSIEPLFEKLGQTVLASIQIKKIDVKILPNEVIHNTQSLSLNPSVESSILGVTNLNIQSVFRQSLQHDQLHSANVQAGIRIQSVKQEVNLSLLRIVYQFYMVVGNAVEYTGIDEIMKPDNNPVGQQEEFYAINSRTSTMVDQVERGIENLVLRSVQSSLLHPPNNISIDPEIQCWTKLREFVALHEQQSQVRATPSDRSKQPTVLPTPSDSTTSAPPQSINTQNDNLLLSVFGWLIIDEIYSTATLGSLKVDGCMRKVQGSVTLSQRLRTVQPNTINQNAKKYDGSLIVQLGSTSLSLKETLSTSNDGSHINSAVHSHQTSTNTSSTAREISVLDIIIGKSRALTSLQTRGMNLTLSGVTNIGTIAMDVPLRPQEVHDLVNRAGRLITSYVQEFLPDDTEQLSTIPKDISNEDPQMERNLNDTIHESTAPAVSEQTPQKKRLNVRHRLTLASNFHPETIETRESISSASKRPVLTVHITAHCQGMTFSTTLLSTLKAQYKIGVVEGVANLGSTTSRFTAIVHEHALHFLNNATNDLHQLPTVSSDNHVRIDFPQIRCYGNYTNEQEQDNRPRGHLNLRTNIDALKLTITADFLAQLVFVSRVIIHEINEILAKVSGLNQFSFGPTKPIDKELKSKSPIDSEEDLIDDDEQEKSTRTPFTYKIDVSMEGFEVIGQTPSNTVVRFHNGDKNLPIFVKLTNYDEQNALLFYNKPSINALLHIKLSLGQLLHTGGFQDAAYFKTKLLLKNSFQVDEPDKEAYIIRLTKPSFYWQPGAIDKGILFWLNYKNTYEHWNEQRGAFTTPTNNATRKRSLMNVQTLPAAIKNELNLMFQLDIIDLGIAIPLQQIDPPSKLTTTDVQTLGARQSMSNLEESSDFLVFTLDQTTISACSCGAIISSGSFEGFCFRFAENFKQTNRSWKPFSSYTSNKILNACCVPSGQYLMHSRAKHQPNSNSPKWFLDVQWDMKGIDINIDSIIGKRFTQLIRTITATHLIEPMDRSSNDNDSSVDSNLLNTKTGSSININENNDPSEDDERRKRLQYEYSILGQKIAALKRSQASDEALKPEEARYQWLEKELLHTVKTDIQQKIKQSNKNALNRDRNRGILSTLSVPSQNRASSLDFTHQTRKTPERHYSLMYAAALASSTGADHRRISVMVTPQSQIYASPIREEDTEDNLSRTSSIPARTTSHESDDRQSITSTTTYGNPNEITSTPAVDLELNIQILIANGSCNLYTRRDLISHPLSTPNVTKQQSQQQMQAAIGLILTVNKIEYQVLQFSLPGVDVDAHYNSEHNNTTNSALNKRGSFHCRATIQSPTNQILIHPILLNFIEQTLEYVKLPREHTRHDHLSEEIKAEQTNDDDHLDTMFLMEDQTSTTSFPIDVVVSIFIQPCVLLFTCLPTHPMECELRLPAVDVVLSSKRALPENTTASNENSSEQVLGSSLGGLSFSLCMKDFKLNVYHPFSGESKVHLFEDIHSGQLQTRNALAVSVQSVSINISRTRYISVDQNNELLNSIKLSVVAQISKAQFEYDMRRFTEILTFPKIWYNRSLARRLFLGDENLPARIPTPYRMAQVTVPTQASPTTNKTLQKQAHVILAIQLKELHVSMRMSNVMGKVEWNTKNVSSTGRLTLTSKGKRTFFISLGLQNSILQAEQGIVGGMIRLKNLRTTGYIFQELRDRIILVDASHSVDILTEAIEIRLDYMGSPTLMGRICHILLRLKDYRPSTTVNNTSSDSVFPFKSVLLNLNWSQLHLMITRSTTPDIIKMVAKLTEFFDQNVNNSRSFLASIQSDFRDSKKSKSPEKNSKSKKPPTLQAKYDINIIKKYIGMHGGELMLQGHNLTIVVFHGMNFRARQWALFSMNEPQINFITNRGEEGDIHQELIFSLGDQSQTTPASVKSRTNMASVSKVTRNGVDAPPLVTVNEWFNYASSTISAVGLRDFPLMDEPEVSAVPSKVRPKQYEQTAESIFILPALELRFQTRQYQGQVQCSFETEFYEHIMFSFNAEHFYFLHDLISSYIKEKERNAAVVAVTNEKSSKRSNKPSVTSPEPQVPPALDDVGNTDTRRFICPDSKWKLQPTIKLLTTYGNEVEPFGADYILQKLGFRHARLTIPKWLQRGIMDPCEQSMTIVQLILIFLLPERFKEMCMK
ncbi:unnamed protein product [Adineta ricciae]|uniref:Bridge-like lipid transfer protein family member 1 C-terminal domain-containing protein n=2 Tax=Adineta ricciae TaxID=249248 RepID=A0A814IZ97_ADIRI|nr:unnamed protein product [Adineta ricciae]